MVPDQRLLHTQISIKTLHSGDPDSAKNKKERIAPAVCMNYGNISSLSFFLSFFTHTLFFFFEKDATGKSVAKAKRKNKGVYLSVSVNRETMGRDPNS